MNIDPAVHALADTIDTALAAYASRPGDGPLLAQLRTDGVDALLRDAGGPR